MPSKSKRILIVEDEKPMALALELKLNREGFEALAVFNGEEAIDALKKEKFDLVLMDLVMPKMDGFQLLEEMQKLKISVPAVVLSNLSQAEDEKKAKQLGAKGFYIKSNTPISEIVGHVRDLFK